MKFINPIAVTDAVLTSASIPETDYTAWSAATAYSVGQRVIRTNVHAIYERLVAGTTATAPESDTVNWVRVGPTNRWAPFDLATGTAATATGTISYTLTPGTIVDSIGLLDLAGDTVTVTVTSGGTTVYNNSASLVTGTNVTDFDQYFYGQWLAKTVVVFRDLPPYTDAVITGTVTSGSSAAIGTCILGTLVDVGSTLYGASVGIIDYSTKTTDTYGVTTITKRSYARRMSIPVQVENWAIDDMVTLLASVRATPVLWIGTDTYTSSVVFGIPRDWQIEITYPTVSHCTLTIDGLA